MQNVHVHAQLNNIAQNVNKKAHINIKTPDQRINLYAQNLNNFFIKLNEQLQQTPQSSHSSYGSIFNCTGIFVKFLGGDL